MNYNKIKTVLEEKKLTQAWLADKMNVSRNAINAICSNRAQPSLKKLFEIASILQVEVCDLLEEGQ